MIIFHKEEEDKDDDEMEENDVGDAGTSTVGPGTPSVSTKPSVFIADDHIHEKFRLWVITSPEEGHTLPGMYSTYI